MHYLVKTGKIFIRSTNYANERVFNLTLSKQITLGYALMFFLMIFISGLSIYSIYKLDKAASNIEGRHSTLLNLLSSKEKEAETQKNFGFGNEMLNEAVKIIDEQNKNDILSRCCFAVTKPGTITLELALLKCPMIITYKVPLFNYLIMKTIIQTKFVGLPNLFASKELCKELLQDECTTQALIQEATILYDAFLANSTLYQQKLNDLEAFRQTFK